MIEKFRRYELKWMDEMEYNPYMELSFRSLYFLSDRTSKRPNLVTNSSPLTGKILVCVPVINSGG